MNPFRPIHPSDNNPFSVLVPALMAFHAVGAGKYLEIPSRPGRCYIQAATISVSEELPGLLFPVHMLDIYLLQLNIQATKTGRQCGYGLEVWVTGRSKAYPEGVEFTVRTIRMKGGTKWSLIEPPHQTH